jgi:hypothetical protein
MLAVNIQDSEVFSLLIADGTNKILNTTDQVSLKLSKQLPLLYYVDTLINMKVFISKPNG